MRTSIQQIKQRFGIIGNSSLLNRAIDVAMQVAPTDISVLVTGESGTGKETIPQIIHQMSSRKHANYIAVNCGAIPEGTIDSELFGHEKGSFTGAQSSRKGYFEEADGGTIFLDEVAELPAQTQVRLLRVLETGEYMRVGSSKVLKSNVRVVAATNENIQQAIKKGKFREDLLYRLSTVPIYLPPLRDRKEDIHLIFRKFANDFSEKYRMPSVRLNDDAVQVLENYQWPGNIRQLKNLVEQISVIEQERNINAEILKMYLPKNNASSSLQVTSDQSDDFNEREILYKLLFDMRNDITELKKIIIDMAKNNGNITENNASIISKFYHDVEPDGKMPKLLPSSEESSQENPVNDVEDYESEDFIYPHEEVEESLSLEDKEKEMIEKALEKYRGKRKTAARELGISERTLYRKIKEYNIDK